MITSMDKILRLCTKCGEFKDPKEDFSKRAASPDGLNRYCKLCMSKYYLKDRVKQNKRLKARNKAHPEIMRAQHLKGKYNMTPEEYAELVIKQGAKCAICGLPFDKLVVDHNHETGKVRGLLCKQCNYALTGGIAWLLKAAQYLRDAGEE